MADAHNARKPRGPKRKPEGLRPALPQRASSAAEEQAVDAAANVAKITLVTMLQLDGSAPRVADFGESLVHGGPVHFAIAEVRPCVSAFFSFEIFEMHFDDAFAECANPILRISVKYDIAYVKPGFDPRTVKLVDVTGHFERTEKEFVP